MEHQASQLMTECFDKNMIDKDERPQTAQLELRCVQMLASCGPPRLPRVAPISISGHKYGPSTSAWAGWCGVMLPRFLKTWSFRVNYLGGDMPTLALNFSRPGAQVIAQYYNFLRLGFEDYQRVQQPAGRWPPHWQTAISPRRHPCCSHRR